METLATYRNEYLRGSFMLAMVFASVAHAVVISSVAIVGTANEPGVLAQQGSVTADRDNRLIIELATVTTAHINETTLPRREQSTPDRGNNPSAGKASSHPPSIQVATNTQLHIQKKGKTLILESLDEPVVIQPQERIDHAATATWLREFIQENRDDCFRNYQTSLLYKSCSTRQRSSDLQLAAAITPTSPIKTVSLHNYQALAEIKRERAAHLTGIPIVQFRF